jgi:ATP-binding cassette subfamily B protein
VTPFLQAISESPKREKLSKQQLEIRSIPDSHIKWLISIVFSHKFIAIYIIIGTILTIVFNMARPIVMGIFFDDVWNLYNEHIATGNDPSFWVFFSKWHINMTILKYSAIILGLGLGYLLFGITTAVLNEYIAQATERDIREDFYASVQSKSMAFHDTAKVGDLMSKATFDVRIINATVSPGIRMITQVIVTAGIAIGMTFYYDWRIALILLASTPLYIWTTNKYTNKLQPLTEKVQEQFGDCNSVLQENLSGIRVVRAFTAEDHEIKYFRKEVNTLRDDIIARGRQQALYFPPLILSVTIAISLALSIVFIYQGSMSGGEAITINSALVQLYDPTYQISWVLYLTQMGIAGAKRILKTMKEEEIIIEDSEAIVLDNIEGKVTYDNVDFSYYNLANKRKKRNPEADISATIANSQDKEVSGRDTLSNINFTIEPGEIVAILGPTGSGKSTLTKLLARMYDVDTGRILVDDIDIKNINLESLRKNIGVIEQEVFLFSTTIKENIAYGVEREVSDEEIIKIAKAAQAHEFIISFKNGYDTLVGERGVTLSGGQKQRIAIARAFLTDPKVLILDDSSSAIDAKTEEKIQTTMDNLLQNRTVFIITHRLVTIKRADKIIVLRKGEIVAKGTHEELLHTSEDYRRIFGRHIDLPPLQKVAYNKKKENRGA